MHTCIHYNFTKAHFSIGVSQEVNFSIPTTCLSIMFFDNPAPKIVFYSKSDENDYLHYDYVVIIFWFINLLYL